MRKKMSILLVVFCSFATLSALENFDPEKFDAKLQQKLDSFLNATTEAAQRNLLQFSESELQTVGQAVKNSFSKKDKRLFWIIEEHSRRNAERIERERVFYLYFAVLSAVGLILVFASLIYVKTRSVEQ